MKEPKLERELAMRTLMAIRKDKMSEVLAYYELYIERHPTDYKVLANINENYSKYMVRKHIEKKEPKKTYWWLYGREEEK